MMPSCLCGYDVSIIMGLLYFTMIIYVEMFSFIKCEAYDAVHGYHVMMWPSELLYVMCTYDEWNYYMKNDEDGDVINWLSSEITYYMWVFVKY